MFATVLYLFFWKIFFMPLKERQVWNIYHRQYLLDNLNTKKWTYSSLLLAVTYPVLTQLETGHIIKGPEIQYLGQTLFRKTTLS